MFDQRKYNSIINELINSKNEEEVILNLKNLIKGFEFPIYQKVIFDNPYYKLLIPDVKKLVLVDFNKTEIDLQFQIKGIDEILCDISKEQLFSEFKSLKRECVSMLYDLRSRKKVVEDNL